MLPELSDYTPDQLSKAAESSSAIHRYLNIVSRPMPADFGNQLRWRRHQDWLRCALATFFSTQPASVICEHWSKSADQLVDQAWAASGANDLPMAIFALGKLGSRELNLSSDIDVVIVSEPPADEQIIKAMRSFRAFLAESTEFGFCLRVDFDLRPGGRLGPLVSSLKQFEDYYWNQGSTWERLAFVRFRPLVGQASILEELEQIVTRFTYRKFLDYTLMEDLKGLRGQIRGHYESAKGDVRNLKYDPGGIRDVELFVHALQVLHGGRLPSVRTFSTSKALEALKSKKLFDPVQADFLHNTYWFYRQMENSLQIINDQQTYIWPATKENKTQTAEFDRLSTQVNETVSTLLGRAEEREENLLPLELEDQKQWLKNLGFNQDTLEKTWPELIQLTVLSKSSQRDEAARRQFLFRFVHHLSAIRLDMDLAMALLVDFVKSIRAKATFFTLLIHEDRLIKDLALLFSTSPYLGNMLASRPELIDSYLLRSQDMLSTSSDEFFEQLAERRLLSELIASNQFLSDRNVHQFTSNLSMTADDICENLLKVLKDEIGPSELKILALGKWGGGELGLRSDLDFIFISPDQSSENDYKIARRFISRLTDQHRGGRIYSIDMRLRPSGKAGPLLTSMEKLQSYLQNEAAAWERQSYLRARLLGGESNPTPILHPAAQRGLSSHDIAELRDIRQKLLTAIDQKNIDVKLNPGGLVDIELAVQARLLKETTAPTGTSTSAMLNTLKNRLSSEENLWTRVGEIYDFLRTLEQLHQLCGQTSGSLISTEGPSFQRLAQLLKIPPNDLQLRLMAHLQEAQQILKDLDPVYSAR